MLAAVLLLGIEPRTHLELAVVVLPHPGVSSARTDGCQHLRPPEAYDACPVGGACEFSNLKCNVGVADTSLLADAATCGNSPQLPLYGYLTHICLLTNLATVRVQGNVLTLATTCRGRDPRAGRSAAMPVLCGVLPARADQLPRRVCRSRPHARRGQALPH